VVPGPAQCPVPLTSPCTTFVNTLITTFRSSHFATAHAKAHGGHVTIDPTPFLSAVVTVSAALVAIIGGLLVAKFVGLDADQRASRKILTDARERLRLAQGRERTAWRAILRSDAGRFFSTPWVIDAIVDEGVVSPAELIRMASWSHDPDELTPFVTEVAEEAGRAREAITPRIRSDDVSWGDFRRRNPDLPEVRWPGAWEHVFGSIAEERDTAEKAEAEARRRAAPPRSAMERAADQVNDMGRSIQRQQSFMATAAIPRPQTDYAATAARRSDDLLANHTRAQQQVEDLDAELRRVEQDHAEIARPDGRLWWGIGILIVFTILGVVVPLGVMATGPRDLAPVRWVLYPFIGSLVALIVYIVVYLVQLTRNKHDQPTASA
jgi:hypothetical protein